MIYFNSIDDLGEKAYTQLQTVNKSIKLINDQFRQSSDEKTMNSMYSIDERIKRIDEKDAQKSITVYRELLNVMLAENISSRIIPGYIRKGIGFSYYRLGEWKKAIDELLTYIEVEPNDMEAFFSIGFCYQKLGNHKKAAKYFEEMVRIDDQNPVAFCHWGIALKHLYNDTKDVACLRLAIEKYRRAAEIQPDYYDAVHNQATALEDLHIETNELVYLNQSIAKYEEAIEIKSDLSQPHFNYCSALIYLFHARQEPDILDDALMHGNRVLELDPEDKNIYYNIACVYALKKMKSEMIEALEEAIKAGIVYKKLAREDRDFAQYHNDTEFITLTKQEKEDIIKDG